MYRLQCALSALFLFAVLHFSVVDAVVPLGDLKIASKYFPNENIIEGILTALSVQNPLNVPLDSPLSTPTHKTPTLSRQKSASSQSGSLSSASVSSGSIERAPFAVHSFSPIFGSVWLYSGFLEHLQYEWSTLGNEAVSSAEFMHLLRLFFAFEPLKGYSVRLHLHEKATVFTKILDARRLGSLMAWLAVAKNIRSAAIQEAYLTRRLNAAHIAAAWGFSPDEPVLMLTMQSALDVVRRAFATGFRVDRRCGTSVHLAHRILACFFVMRFSTQQDAIDLGESFSKTLDFELQTFEAAKLEFMYMKDASPATVAIPASLFGLFLAKHKKGPPMNMDLQYFARMQSIYDEFLAYEDVGECLGSYLSAFKVLLTLDTVPSSPLEDCVFAYPQLLTVGFLPPLTSSVQTIAPKPLQHEDMLVVLLMDIVVACLLNASRADFCPKRMAHLLSKVQPKFSKSVQTYFEQHPSVFDVCSQSGIGAFAQMLRTGGVFDEKHTGCHSKDVVLFVQIMFGIDSVEVFLAEMGFTGVSKSRSGDVNSWLFDRDGFWYSLQFYYPHLCDSKTPYYDFEVSCFKSLTELTAFSHSKTFCTEENPIESRILFVLKEMRLANFPLNSRKQLAKFFAPLQTAYEMLTLHWTPEAEHDAEFWMWIFAANAFVGAIADYSALAASVAHYTHVYTVASPVGALKVFVDARIVQTMVAIFDRYPPVGVVGCTRSQWEAMGADALVNVVKMHDADAAAAYGVLLRLSKALSSDGFHRLLKAVTTLGLRGLETSALLLFVADAPAPVVDVYGEVLLETLAKRCQKFELSPLFVTKIVFHSSFSLRASLLAEMVFFVFSARADIFEIVQRLVDGHHVAYAKDFLCFVIAKKSGTSGRLSSKLSVFASIVNSIRLLRLKYHDGHEVFERFANSTKTEQELVSLLL